MLNSLTGFRVAGIAGALPKNVFDLQSLSDSYGAEEVSRIIKSTGIRQVRIAPDDVCASDLCLAAAQKLLAELGLTAADVDGLLFISQTPDYPMPATACAMQDRLGMSRESVALQVNYGCSAYIYGLFLAGTLIQTGSCNRVLLCAGDTTSRLVNSRDKSVRFIFGDAGAATIIERTPASETARWPFILRTDGAGSAFLTVPAGGARMPHSNDTAIARECESGNFRSPENVYMDGMEIMNFSLREVPPTIREILEHAGWTAAEAGAFVFHQANLFIVDYLRRKLKLDPGAVPIEVEDVGNTGPASIPLTLCRAHARLRQEGRLEKVVLCGFGAGLSWGATACDLRNALILDPLEL